MKTLLSSFKITLKLVLTLSILLIIKSPLYSQQTSKILYLLQDKLKTNNLYFEPLDLVLAQNVELKFIKYKNVTIPYYTNNAESQHHETMFDDLLKAAPDNLKLFDRYSVDTISYYFKKSKLVKFIYQFEMPGSGRGLSNDSFKSLYIQLNNDFKSDKEAMETNVAGYLGYRWADDYVEVNLLADILMPNAKNNALAYLSIEMFNPTFNHLLEKQIAQIKVDRSGSGNGTFNISVDKLESIIKLHTTLKSLENQFGKWSSFGNLNNVEFQYDETNKSFSIPIFKIEYESSIKNKGYYFNAEVSNLNDSVKYFEFTTTLNGIQLAEIKKSLAINNYLLNENLTSIFNKLTYQNRAKKLTISVKENKNNTYTIGVR
jgi:hypothetical protein